MKAILFVSSKKPHARSLGKEIAAELESRNIAAEICSFGEKTAFPAGKGCDLALSLGGDGTVLYAARAMSPMSAPIFPINLGTFGFIAGVEPSEWREVFDRWLDGRAALSRRIMLEARVERGDREIFRGSCLNDVIVSSSGASRLINLRLSSGDDNMSPALKLGSYRSDALIISTPTGSTAYSAAAGGPIVDPELEAIILSPVCPFTLTHRPMVLSANETVLVEVDEKQRGGIILTLDGQVTEKLKSGDRVFLKKAPYSCQLIESGRKGFFEALRTKLSWIGEEERML